MADKRPSNSEQRLIKLEEEESQREDQPGILEIFDRDEDAPISRDDAEVDPDVDPK
jgi:hypothetical protein